MSKQESTFHLKDLRDTAHVQHNGVLDQLDLPPGLVEFLQKNQRKIWTMVGIAAVVVITVSLYTSYRTHMLNNAVTAYDHALLLDGDQKKAALQKVAEDYSSTPSATWSRIELAHIEQETGNLSAAIDRLEELKSGLKEKDLLRPLVLANLGGLYEQNKQADKAITTYEKLKKISGFEAMALSSLGRVYETKGEKDKAVAAYQRYMSLTGKKDAQDGDGRTPQMPDSPDRELVQFSLNRLLQ
ncbi:MAG: YfgM family protein [Candidatus Electrothrix sp. YB6]